MSEVTVWSENDIFKCDLESQISRYVEAVALDTQNPDIIIVDENFSQYKIFRQKFPTTPIVFLSSMQEIVSDRLNITVKKPFKLIQLLDIIRAANHKLDQSEEGYITFNSYNLKPLSKEIEDTKLKKSFKLTEKEIEILKYLYKNSDRYVSKTDLQTNVWKYSESVNTHTIETHIYRLRQKVENQNRRLIVTHNNGYKLGQDE